MKEAYDRVGAVVVRNTGLTQGVDMKAVVHAVTNGSVKYEGGANPRDAVPEASVYDTGAPLDVRGYRLLHVSSSRAEQPPPPPLPARGHRRPTSTTTTRWPTWKRR